jgi:hypothetical protein
VVLLHAPILRGRTPFSRRIEGKRGASPFAPPVCKLARLRYIRFGSQILVADIIVVAGAMALEYRDEGAARLPTMLFSLAVATGSVAIVLLWWGRRERRRAERLAAVQRAMAQDPENPHE